MEKGIVIQLQEDAINGNVDIEELLRKAYLVAHKLDIKDFKEWIKNEQNGYKSGKVPDYRIIGGKIRACNPVYGWIPAVFEDDSSKYFETFNVVSSIANILYSYNASKLDNKPVDFELPPGYEQLLNSHTSGFKTNHILNWALLLEDNGIKGDGLSFNNEEKESAENSSVVNNYTNNFYSAAKNTRISQGNSIEKKKMNKYEIKWSLRYKELYIIHEYKFGGILFN